MVPPDDPADLAPLDPALLARLRDEGVVPVPAGARDRVRARLAASLVALGAVGALGVATSGGLGAGAASGAAVAARAGLGARLVGLLRAPWFAFGTFAAGTALGAAVHAALGTPTTRVVYVDRPVPALAPPPAPAVTAPTPSIERGLTPAPAEAAPAPRAPLAASPSNGAGLAPRSGSQLAAERTLLDDARGALAQGEPLRALEKLDRHRRAFTSPLLADERDAMNVQALVKAERESDARAAAEAFKKRAPGSLFVPMVDAAIASIPKRPAE